MEEAKRGILLLSRWYLELSIFIERCGPHGGCKPTRDRAFAREPWNGVKLRDPVRIRLRLARRAHSSASYPRDHLSFRASISFQEEWRIEQESCRRHFDTWRRLWGRPGHGAPMDHAQRNNLYNILHRSAIYWIPPRCVSPSSKATVPGDGAARFITGGWPLGAGAAIGNLVPAGNAGSLAAIRINSNAREERCSFSHSLSLSLSLSLSFSLLLLFLLYQRSCVKSQERFPQRYQRWR